MKRSAEDRDMLLQTLTAVVGQAWQGTLVTDGFSGYTATTTKA